MSSSLLALASTQAADCLPCNALTAAAMTPGPRWKGVLGVEGELTGDGRLIEPNALEWADLPLPIRYVSEDVGAHDGAVVVGMIDKVYRDGALIMGEGSFDGADPVAMEACRKVREGFQRGISMDLDSVAFEIRVAAEMLDPANDPMMALLMGMDGPAPEPDADGKVTVATMKPDDEVRVTTAGRLRAATLVAIPAFAKAQIDLVEEPAADAETPTEGVLPDGQTPCSCDEADEAYDPECQCGEAEAPSEGEVQPPARSAIAASAAPMAPPRAWFANPALKKATPFTVTADGRVFGHLATWGTCHIGVQGSCVTPPSSRTSYAYFHVGSVLTDDGTEVAVGHVTLDTKHAAPAAGLTVALAHYDNTGTVVADVTAGEDSFGIWVAGALRPRITDEQKRALRAAPLSGDWRRVQGNLELVAALAVNVPGFPVPRPAGMVASGHVQSLVAAGIMPHRTMSRSAVDALSADDLRYLKRLIDRERQSALPSQVLATDAALLRARVLRVRAHAGA